MPRITIEQLEAAINIWRNRKPSPEGKDEAPALCPEARVLADVYAAMIFTRAATVETSELSPAQASAYADALTR